MFAVVVERRTEAVMLPILMKFIRPGSIIHSDMWKAYNNIPNCTGFNWSHSTVNHSKEFKSAEGTCTNTIEGSWHSKFKLRIPGRYYNKNALPGQLFKSMWLNNNKDDLWNTMWKVLSCCEVTEDGGLGLTDEWVDYDIEDSPLPAGSKRPFHSL